MKVIKNKLNESKQDYEDLAYEVFSMLEDMVDKFYTWDVYPELEKYFPELAKQNSKVLYQGVTDDISNMLTDAILEPVKDDLMYESVDSKTLKESIGKELMKINNMFLKEDFEEKNLEKPGTKEYEANSKRQKRINMYRVFANLTADEPITEDNIDQWALERTSAWTNVGIDRIKAEILGQKWSDYEI